MFSSLAYAQGGGQPKPSILETLFPFIMIFFIFYLFILRPQSRKAKEHQKALGNLKRGDEVLTSSGILGTIEGLTEKYVTLEISEGVRIKMLKSQVAGLAKQKEGSS